MSSRREEAGGLARPNGKPVCGRGEGDFVDAVDDREAERQSSVGDDEGGALPVVATVVSSVDGHAVALHANGLEGETTRPPRHRAARRERLSIDGAEREPERRRRIEEEEKRIGIRSACFDPAADDERASFR